MAFLARSLRAVRLAWMKLRSQMLCVWFQALFPGLVLGRGVTIGRGVRIDVLNGATLVIGDRTVIEANCQLRSEGSVSIGPDAFIGMGSIIIAARSVQIGSDALIAAHVTIRDQDHRFDLPNIPYRNQGQTIADVVLGNNVWLGSNVCVLKGSIIGDGAIVGANSVVLGKIGPNTLVVGAPARLVRHLDSQRETSHDTS